jgi:DNA polymerase III sliding clamp (beta) subunit (PCNA family)
LTTKITFETALISDAVQKAARVAPSKGPAFDRAAGIYFEIDHADKTVTVKSTNLDVTYQQRVAFLESEQGTAPAWRLPSQLLSKLFSSLPMGSGATVQFIDQEDNSGVYIKSGKFVGKLSLLDANTFPTMDPFLPEGMLPANEFASRVEQVAWAAESKADSPLGGVHIDGKNLVGCDKYSLAIVPCEVPIEKPVTVPLWTIAQLLKQASDVNLRATIRNLELMLDAETQATALLINADQPYPAYQRLMRTPEECFGTMIVNKTEFKEALSRQMSLVSTEKQPRLQMEWSGDGMFKEVILDVNVPQVGRFRESVMALEREENDAFDSKFRQIYKPNAVVQAVEMARGDLLFMSFGGTDAASDKKPLRLSDVSGYECYIMPIIEKG